MKKAIVILSILLIVSLVANLAYYIRDGPPEEKEHRETYIDTIPYRVPVPVDSCVIKYVTDTLPLAGASEYALIGDTTALVEKSVTDSATVIIPITQKVYEDSLFRAYVSGYHPALDSIEIYRKSETIYIRSPTKPKRWSVGIQAGLGLTPNNIQPYIGVGVSYNILSF